MTKFYLDPSYEFTNDPKIEHKVIEPFANEEHVETFKDLQLFESVGLVEPVDADHMDSVQTGLLKTPSQERSS